MLRSGLRGAILSTMGLRDRLGGRLQAALCIPRVQVLYLHHLWPAEMEPFKVLLRILSSNYTFLSYSDAFARIASRSIDRPYMTFSADDGFKDNIYIAEILEEFGAKAAFFVCPRIIGERDTGQIRRFCAQRLHCPESVFLDWPDIEQLLKHGHEIGSHTQRHANLAQCSADEAREEIEKSREDLGARCGPITHFAWPYGRFSDFNGRARDLVFDAGYHSCASAERGCHRPQRKGSEQRDLCIRRDHVVAKWPPSHILSFITRNALCTADSADTFAYLRSGLAQGQRPSRK